MVPIESHNDVAGRARETRARSSLALHHFPAGAGTITASGDGQSTTLGLPAATKIWVYLPTDSA